MLIGGPNQSHKVNFKEPLPVKGKMFKRTFVICFVNTFPEIFRKSFEGTTISKTPSNLSLLIFQETLTEGSREHVKAIFLIKIFRNKNGHQL